MASASVMYLPFFVLPYQREPFLWYAPVAVLTQTVESFAVRVDFCKPDVLVELVFTAPVGADEDGGAAGPALDLPDAFVASAGPGAGFGGGTPVFFGSGGSFVSLESLCGRSLGRCGACPLAAELLTRHTNKTTRMTSANCNGAAPGARQAQFSWLK